MSPVAKRARLEEPETNLDKPQPSEVPSATTVVIPVTTETHKADQEIGKVVEEKSLDDNINGDISSEDEAEEVYREDASDQKARTDLYLDTINREMLDFDFEKLCSVSLSNNNVYCCLVDGKYFQGRGKNSWAYKHSVNEGKHVFLKLDTEEFFILPDGYKVSDPSLEDIIKVLAPRYTHPQISRLSYLPSSPSYDLSARPYLPGYIGLNNIKANDYENVIIHSLLHVPPLRDFFLAPDNKLLQPESKPTELVKKFAELARKVWNPDLFKAQVSPHELLQEVSVASEGKFKVTKQGDPIEFLGWLLNRLHKDLGGSRKKNSSIIYKTFQGDLKIETQQYMVKADSGGSKRPQFDIGRETTTATPPFLFLALDLPRPPLFQDSVEKNIIPQVSLASILAKYDGNTTQEFGDQLKRHKLTRLPPYLILHTKRFTKNNFVEDKNPTIVNFPLRGVDMHDYVEPLPAAPHSTVYDLLINIPYESSSASTTTKVGSATATNPKKKQQLADGLDNPRWKVHLRAGGGGGDGEKWFSIEDLRVDEVQREMVFLGETVLQIWQRRDLGPNGAGLV
ncbi:spindle pole body protein [Phaffia rhodozyma]|uniref:Spindle pole body protein n=1 Tax=Phaffia rhodozyma TaxID=264483 RepID=A0A0F7SHW3_PHARH|nr:spindle pole body protein [Phaffia rhodozyma]